MRSRMNRATPIPATNTSEIKYGSNYSFCVTRDIWNLLHGALIDLYDVGEKRFLITAESFVYRTTVLRPHSLYCIYYG